MERISKLLIGASATSIILSILKQGESYGYEIIQKVNEFSNGEIQWHEVGIYPILKKLEKEGMLKSSWKFIEGERPRRYYTIQKAGLNQHEINKYELEIVQNLFKRLADLE